MSDYPTLSYFVGGWLNQDWVEDYDTVWDVVNGFLADEPGKADELRADVHRLVLEGRSDDELKDLLVYEMQCGYYPPGDGLTYSTWLAAFDGYMSGLQRGKP
jgi:CdiI immunity protein